MNIIIPIGGIGDRFLKDQYLLPKPLIRALGKPILFWNLESLNISKEDKIFIVYRKEFNSYNFCDIIKNKFYKYNFIFIEIDNITRGAAETVLCALNQMKYNDLKKTTLVLDSDNFYGDDILTVCKKSIDNIIFYKKNYEKNEIYSYIKLDKGNNVIDIIEKEKISDNICVGAYCFSNGKLLKETIKYALKNDKKQKNEFYISGLYKILLEKKIKVLSNEIQQFYCLGTPNQLKSFSSLLNNDTQKYRFCFDLDNTLVTYPEVYGDYTSVKPIQKVINFVKYIHSLGHIVIIHTARRMKTHTGNIGKVNADIAKITIDTLQKFNIPYDEIYFGKPYADFYIDDLAITPFQNLEKETGFYNIHPETRSFNRIEIFEKYIQKYSSNLEGEKFYYNNIPKDLQHLFPKLIHSDEDSIKIEKINGIPYSFFNVNDTLSEKLLIKVLDNIKILHSITTDENINIYKNYFEKTKKRIESFNFTGYNNFKNIKNDILNFLIKYQNNKNGKIGIIHGDAVFTNILLDFNDNIKMIDMRGKIGEKLTIYGDIFYDYAKIFQSIIGYDHILMDKEITEYQLKKNTKIFEKYILEHYSKEELKNIKLITKSLILSLIPLHNNEKNKNYYSLLKNIKL